MIRLGLRLTLAGGRESLGRLVLIAVAVAIGVGLLLGTLAGLNAVNKQNARYAWLETGFAGSDSSTSQQSSPTAGGVDPIWWRERADYFQGQLVGRIDVAATGPNSPVPPGIPALPGPGQFYTSPKLAALLRNYPADELRDRYPGTEIGIISRAALPSPDSLIVVIGRRSQDLSHDPRARLEQRISTTSPSRCNGDCAPDVGTNSNGLLLILSVVIAALLFPVLVFVGAASRLSAARREQRFAAVRLVGATPSQVATIATVESVVAATIGVAAGFGVFLALRPLITLIPFTGMRFFTSDVWPTVGMAVLVALAVPVASAVTARLALRRISISPLGVSRRVPQPPPRARRTLPLAVGVAELGYFAYVDNIGANTHTNTTYEAAVFLGGVLLVMAGLVIAGPWLTYLVSGLIANRARRPAALLAARRLADNPQAGFRAVSGVVLAIFVATCAVGIISTITAGDPAHAHVAPSGRATLVDVLADPGHLNHTTALPVAVAHSLQTIHGINGVAVIRDEPRRPPVAPSGAPKGRVVVQAVQQVVACAQLQHVPALGHCQPGASTAAVNPDYGAGFALHHHRSMADTMWPPSDLTVQQLDALPVDTVLVATDGSRAAVERARTVLDSAYPNDFAAETITEIHVEQSRLLRDYQQLAEVVILTSLPIAGVSLAVSIAGGLVERKRPFSLLRLAGTPLATLRRVVGFEAAAPMLITAVASIAVGFLAAFLFLRAQLAETLRGPTLEYYLVVAAGLIASLVVISSTLPLLNRITAPEAVRNE